MGIAGSVKDDLKFFYPDKTGFMFDTPPCNVASGRGMFGLEYMYDGTYFSIPWNKEGGRYCDQSEHEVKKYNGWLNWVHKYEVDNRFLAISDTNAYLNQFPEVQNPWKFTEYIFVGIDKEYIIIEPPLYDPSTLTVVNDIQNNFTGNSEIDEKNRKEGKLRGEGYTDIHYETVYYYRCKFSNEATNEDIINDVPVLGPPRKQYEPNSSLREINGDLESGLVINGKKYPPWTEPLAHPRYKNTFINTQEICGTRRVFKFVTPNRGVIYNVNDDGSESIKYTGVRLYRKDILAKCVDRGQHGNIPPYTINMSAPKDYINPETMYRNAVEVIVTYEAGQAMYAEDNGFISYEGSGNYYNTSVTITTISSWDSGYEYIGGSTQEFCLQVFKAKTGSDKPQPKPNNFGSKFKEKCYGSVSSGIKNGDLIHRGCAFFKGTKDGGCYCSIKKELLESGKTPITNPDDFDGIFGDIILGEDGSILFDPGVGEMSPDKCMSYSESEGDEPSGKECRFYAQQGPREILEFMCDEMSNEEMANSLGFNQSVDFSASVGLGLMGAGLGGTIAGFGIYAMTPDKIEGQSTSLNGMSVRKKVKYQYKEVDLNGKEITGQKTRFLDTRTVKEGSGKFAFDKDSTSAIGGIDKDLFYGSNLLSRNRFCSSVMQCYNAKYCNQVYGMLNLSSGDSPGIFSGVGSDSNYCRYYNAGCPTTEIHQRAREYDREYKNLINMVLSVFRSSGIFGFNGLREVECGDFYAAVGSCDSLSSIMSVKGSLDVGNIYFLYTDSCNSENHINSRVFGFIRQYGKPVDGSQIPESDYLKMSVDKYPKMKSIPSIFNGATEIPWLVMLHDDYVSPSKFESYATNLDSFIGGRMPEYKDMSKMGEEIQCQVTITEPGYDGGLTSGKGGEDKSNDYTTSTSYQYYRVDKTGEWIIEDLDETGDGISIGEDTEDGRKHGDARIALPPSHHNGATPIKGSFINSSYSQENGQIKARVTRGWCFSNDNRDSLENDVASMADEYGESKEVPNAQPPENCLPLERDWYYCPNCSPKPYSYLSVEGLKYDTDGRIIGHNGPNINQIFTDFEYQQYINCPRCGTSLVVGGKMKHFAKCRAEGIVNYFGLPGEIVDGRGFFWKNHTEISRSFISEILSKNGSIIDGKYSRNNSANSSTESSVCVKRIRGENYIKGYMSGDKYEKILNRESDSSITANEYAYTMTNTRGELYNPSFMNNNKRLTDDFYYDDRYLNPYGISEKTIIDGEEYEINNGLDFVSANTVKSLRNMVMPIQGFPLYDNGAADCNTKKQTGYKDRFTQTDKTFRAKRRGFDSFILASNDVGNDMNYVQFWDGTLIPGKCVKAYYPTSPVWWYRHDYVGGIKRSGGQESIHFNYSSNGVGGTSEFGYAGNLISASYHTLQGWLPLDKEVVRAFIYFTPCYYPDEPPVGRTQKGGPMHDKHWHSFTANNFEMATKQNHDEYDRKMLDDVMGWSNNVIVNGNSGGEGLSDGGYIPTNYNGEQFVDGDSVISKYNEESFGFGVSQGWLSWNGFGEDIVQKVTEESIWKKYTFDEFKNIENQFSLNINFEVGDPTEEGSIQDCVTVIPPGIVDGFLNNAGQAITNMFDLSGLNSSNIYDKNGLDFADKVVNNDWAEGGQIIIQEDGGVDTAVNSSDSSYGKESIFDITSLVKKYYDDRVERSFKAELGTAYNEIYNYILKNKIEYENEDGDFDKIVNYRHYNSSIGGYWLNSMAFFPELENGEFPTIDSGMEYKIKPIDICNLDECGSIYLEVISSEDSGGDDAKDYTEENPNYYKYSPHVLCFFDGETGAPSSGSFDSEFNVQRGDWSTCRMCSGNINDLYFTMNISGYPTQTSHRPYRYEAGSWNVSNAICQNKDCFVCMDGVTVAEAAALSAAGKSMYRNRMFSLYSEKCGACRSDLTKSSGAIYSGGDGIETWEYRDIPKKDSIINGFIIDVDSSLCKCGFDVYAKSSTDEYWDILLSVDYDYDSNMFVWRQYSGNDFIKVSGSTLPVFKGIWKDGYNAAGEDLTGYNFIAKRANKIKVVGRPCTMTSSGVKLENEGRIQDVTDVMSVKRSNIVSGSSVQFKTGFNNLSGCEGGFLDIMSDASGENILYSSEIRNYNISSRVISLADELPYDILALDNSNSNTGSSESGQHYYYRIRMLRYVFTVRKFQVYGLELCDNVKITDDASTSVMPIQQGVVSVTFYDKATKILRAMAVNGNSLMYKMNEYSGNGPATSDNLYYYVSYDSSLKKYRIVGGEYFYDTFTNIIYLPYKCGIRGNNGSIGVVQDIDNIYTSENIIKDTIPSAIEIKYMTGAGTSVDVDIESVGEGPSYLLERDTITNIGENSLPSIGNSVFLRRQNKRVAMNWHVTNKERTNYNCGTLSFTGLELASGVTHARFSEFVGGNDETNNGLESDKDGDGIKRIFSGKANGQITLTGLPNCIISGILYVSAPAIRVNTYNFAGNSVTVTERTGGLRKTGFAFIPSVSVGAPDKDGQNLACIAVSKPRIVVYLAERDLTSPLN